MLRAILVAHRWLGVAIGLLMTIWCLSGFVMMYVDYPRLSPAEQAKGLAPIRLPAAADLARVPLPAGTALRSARVEMMDGRPVLRIVPAADTSRPIPQMRAARQSFDLVTGLPVEELGAAAVGRIAAGFARQSGIAGPVAGIEQIEMDQWSVQTSRGHQPLFRVSFADPAGSTIYVAGNDGEVVQQTTRFERFWGWLGAVPHWLYPTLLRRDGALWSQVVIYTSLIGCFLTFTGMWVGIARLRRRRDGSIGSPYRGLWWWHHVFGLFFGILTLTWVASGLFSMNPWGLLDSVAGSAEQRQLAGTQNWGSVRDALARLDSLPAGAVRIEATPLAGQPFLTASDADQRRTRLTGTGRPAPLREPELRRALAPFPLAALDRLEAEDAYYYAHKQPVKLPVWRATLANAESTRLYIDADTGALIRAYDVNGRRLRWLRSGLHSLDLPVMRWRPLWDIVVLPLLAAVTAVCATGTWMAFAKLKRDLRRVRRRRARRAMAAQAPERMPA